MLGLEIETLKLRENNFLEVRIVQRGKRGIDPLRGAAAFHPPLATDVFDFWLKIFQTLDPISV